MSLANKKIVVVGAGPAGLAATARLFCSGARDVTVLEASDRIGGRINSVVFNGNAIEMGAQFVHGEEGNVVFKIVDEMGLVGDPRGDSLYDLDEVFATQDGDILDRDLVRKMAAVIRSAQEGEASHVVTDPGESLGGYFDRAIDHLVAHENDSFKANMAAFKDHFHRSMQTHVSCDHWHMDSFDGTANKYRECPGNPMITYRRDHRYADFLAHFTKDIPARSLHYNSEVTRIREEEDGGALVVEVRDGERIFRADYVIFTGSLGYLKSHARRLFSPQLPRDKLEAIDKIGFGTVDKIFLEFERPWWPMDSNGFAFVSTNEASYGRKDAEVDWTGHVESLNRVEHRDNLLVAWIAGEGARKMESLSDGRILQDLVALMERFLRKGFPLMTPPVGIRVTRWHSNPFTLGSYTHLTVRSATAGITTTALLAAPAFGSKLLFAGEATHHCFFSTVHGAVESGWREADRVAALCSAARARL